MNVGRLHRVVSDLQTFTEVQRVSLIVVDDDLSSAPIRLVHVAHQRHAAGFELRGKCCHAVGLEVEMEMATFIDVRDRWVFLINQLQVDKVAAGANPGVKVVVVEFDRESQLLRVEADR